MLAFLDLETTGLRANKDEILEVGCIVTDDKLVEIARFESLVRPKTEFWQLDELIRDMHTKNGLWKALTDDKATWPPPAIGDVDWQLAEFLREHCVRVLVDDKGKTRVDRPQLAGNTISFDRAFMKVHLPNAEAELHYRNVDVSTLNEVFRRFAPKIWEARPKLAESAAHRAMADAEDSLNVCRYYAGILPATQPTVSLVQP